MEGEYVAIYNGVLKVINIRDTLKNIGYPQLNPSIIVCDNQAAVSVANRKCAIKKSKSTAMRYYIVQDEIDKRTIDVTWRPGKDKDTGNPTNLADAFTKAHLVHYFKKIRPFYTK
jgi:aspartyl/asparaginyl-tRNA synthetase